MLADHVHQHRRPGAAGELVEVRRGDGVEQREHPGARRVAAAVVPVELDRAPRESGEPWRDFRGQGVGPHGIDHDEQHVERGRTRRTLDRGQRIVQVAGRRPLERGADPALACGRPIDQAEPRQETDVAERVVQRQVSGERHHRAVVVGLGPGVDEVRGDEATDEAEREIPSGPARRGARRPLPDPARQHRLDREGHEEIEREERPRLRLE